MRALGVDGIVRKEPHGICVLIEETGIFPLLLQSYEDRRIQPSMTAEEGGPQQTAGLFVPPEL